MEKNDNNLLDYLGKVYLIRDNLLNILSLSDDNFNLLKNSLIENPDLKENPTREQLVAEKTTAMLFQLSVGYLYNLTESITFLKNNHHCDDLFKNNKIYDEFESNIRLICELRNNITFHGEIHGNAFRGLQHILDDLKITKDDSVKKIWISLRCGVELTNQIMWEFRSMSVEKKVISKSMYSKEEIDIIENYFNAKDEFNKLI